MRMLFQQGGEGRVLDFLSANSATHSIVASPRAIADLYYVERELGLDLSAQLSIISVAGLSTMISSDVEAEPSVLGNDRVYVVMDPLGESERVDQLKRLHPTSRFVGLCRDLVPALLARAGHRVEELSQGLPMPSNVMVVLATPRSGSSYLGDVIGQMGLGVAREHLRPTVIELLCSDYKFDRVEAIKNFCRLASQNGWMSTKLITHFVQDYLLKGSIRYFNDALRGVKCHIIGIDRRDKVAQAISGFIASKRGTWHAFRGQEFDKSTDAHIRYDFDAIFARYLSYSEQAAYLHAIRQQLYEFEVIQYEDDVDGRPLAEIAGRLRSAANLTKMGPNDVRFQEPDRVRMSSELNDALAHQFRAELGMRHMQNGHARRTQSEASAPLA